jgi:hypothetical protein
MESNLSAQTATPPTQTDHCEWGGIILGLLHFRHRCAEASISQFLPSVGAFSAEPNLDNCVAYKQREYGYVRYSFDRFQIYIAVTDVQRNRSHSDAVIQIR